MSNVCMTLVLIYMCFILPMSSNAQPACNNFSFEGISKHNDKFRTCVDLPVLDSYVHWNYYPVTAILEIAYRHADIPPTSSKWVAWAINPTSKGMVGSQALVAYHSPEGLVKAYTVPISSYGTKLAEGQLNFNVSGLKAVGVNNEIIIFATIRVPNNATVLNQVWQDGPLSKDCSPEMHSTSGSNVQSMASLDLLSSVSPFAVIAAPTPAFSLRNIHALLNGVSWGTMMPIGAIIARHKSIFSNPAWFYLHVGCQVCAYIIGAAGWATGIKLGNDSSGFTHSIHGNIGITLFLFATLQVSALLIRPKKDHKYRFCWKIFHHTIGYLLIILIPINILIGFHILNPGLVWKRTYIGVAMVLTLISLGMELFRRYAVSQKKGGGGIKPNEA